MKLLISKNELERQFIREALQKGLNFINRNDIDGLLKYEKSHYHQFCKSPDTEHQYSRFYSLYEHIFSYASQLAPLADNALKATEMEVALSNLLTWKIQKSPALIILRGTCDLANGLVLLGAIESLNSKQKSKILLCLTDYSHEQALIISKDIGVRGIGLGGLDAEAKKLQIIYRAVLEAQKLGTEVDLTYWSIAFGMVYLYSSLAEAGHIGERSFVSCKYGYPYSQAYLTRLVTGPGMPEHTKASPIHIEISHIAYRKADLEIKGGDILPEKLRSYINSLKANGYILWSSMAREEKLVSSQYLRVISDEILQGHKKSSYILCGKRLLEDHRQIFNSSDKRRLSYVGWINTKALVKHLDFYLDPFPHGGGHSLALAIRVNIPCIIPMLPTTQASPSLIQVIIPALKTLQKKMDKDAFAIIFPTTIEGVHKSVATMCTNVEARRMVGNAMTHLDDLLSTFSNRDARIAVGLRA